MTLEWGTGPSSDFTWLRNGDTATMTAGADGGCFIDSTLRLTGTSATEILAEATVSVDGYEPLYQPPQRLPLLVAADGARYAIGLRESLTDGTPSSLSGRKAMVVVRVTADGCSSWTATEVLIAE